MTMEKCFKENNGLDGFFETSARTGTGVEKAFIEAAKQLYVKNTTVNPLFAPSLNGPLDSLLFSSEELDSERQKRLTLSKNNFQEKGKSKSKLKCC